MRIVKITEAKFLDNYRILLIFNDNKAVIVDFEDLLKSSPYSNEKKFLQKELFQQFRIELGDLVWKDYDMCFQAKNLYKGILRK